MASPDQAIDGLSGGNQQKVILARWLARDPKVLIVDEPTRGVDVGAKAEVHQILVQLAGRGIAIMMISSELPRCSRSATGSSPCARAESLGDAGRDATEETLMALMALDPSSARSGVRSAGGRMTASAPLAGAAAQARCASLSSSARSCSSGLMTIFAWTNENF
jgi:hypothetical protein